MLHYRTYTYPLSEGEYTFLTLRGPIEKVVATIQLNPDIKKIAFFVAFEPGDDLDLEEGWPIEKELWHVPDPWEIEGPINAVRGPGREALPLDLGLTEFFGEGQDFVVYQKGEELRVLRCRI